MMVWQKSFLENDTLAPDSRPSVADVLRSFDKLREGCWQCSEICQQFVVSEDNEQESVPIRAYYNSSDVDWVVIAGIHGREPAGVIALSSFIENLLSFEKKKKILVLPFLNPYGYYNHVRYGPDMQSVSDSDHLLGRADLPACPEAAAITEFITKSITINQGAAVLDLHEDPVYEAEGYEFSAWGSYVYVAGNNSPNESPVTKRVLSVLKSSSLPLISNGVTRFGEELTGGMILNSADGSIDELLASIGATPVITVENLLHAPNNPELELRVNVYRKILEQFFDAI